MKLTLTPGKVVFSAVTLSLLLLVTLFIVFIVRARQVGFGQGDVGKEE